MVEPCKYGRYNTCLKDFPHTFSVPWAVPIELDLKLRRMIFGPSPFSRHWIVDSVYTSVSEMKEKNEGKERKNV